jgi:site-specific DNA-methyltransferase (adenine-specific)
MSEPISIVENIDNMKFMAQFPDKFFDLTIADPEYGIKASEMTMGSGKHKFKKGKNWDIKIPDNEYFEQLFRVSKNQTIWGGNYFTEYLIPTKNWLVWDKCNPNLSFAEGEFAWQSVGTGIRIYKYYSALQDKIHPTQKPVSLYRWILQNYAKKGDKILDANLGSGSSRIAAYQMGFDFWGCELDKEYFDASCKRFEIEKIQKTIFTFSEQSEQKTIKL